MTLGGDGTANIVRLGRIFTIWVGLFVDVVFFGGRRDGGGGGPVFLELQETALQLGDGAEAELGVFAKFGDGAVAGEGFLGGEGDFEVSEFGGGGGLAYDFAVEYSGFQLFITDGFPLKIGDFPGYRDFGFIGGAEFGS